MAIAAEETRAWWHLHSVIVLLLMAMDVCRDYLPSRASGLTEGRLGGCITLLVIKKTEEGPGPQEGAAVTSPPTLP